MASSTSPQCTRVAAKINKVTTSATKQAVAHFLIAGQCVCVHSVSALFLLIVKVLPRENRLAHTDVQYLCVHGVISLQH
jgi:hypothetical protein